MIEDPQHNDHIWISINGEAWAIHSMDGLKILLWRGVTPELEYWTVDLSSVDWPAYVDECVKRLRIPGKNDWVY